MARNTLPAIELVRRGTWSLDDFQRWLNAVINEDQAYLDAVIPQIIANPLLGCEQLVNMSQENHPQVLEQAPWPLEAYDMPLAEEFRLVANGIHPIVKTIFAGRLACAESGFRATLVLILKPRSRKPIIHRIN